MVQDFGIDLHVPRAVFALGLEELGRLDADRLAGGFQSRPWQFVDLVAPQTDEQGQDEHLELFRVGVSEFLAGVA